MKWFLTYDGKPPLLYPLVWISWVIFSIIMTPFYALLAIYYFIVYPIFYQFPLWLVGFWWCTTCKKRFRFTDQKYRLLEVIGWSIHDYICCKDCYDKYEGRYPGKIWL